MGGNPLNRSGGHYIFGKRIYSEDIVYKRTNVRQDVLNTLLIISDIFAQRAYQIFNPRNAMYINRSDGLLNKAIMVQRDTVINANTLESLSRDSYTKDDLAKMERLYKKNKFDKLLKSF